MEHRSTSSSGRVGQRKNVSVVCEDDIPLSVLRAKWASEMATAKRSATVTHSRSMKRKVTVTRGKRVTQSEKRIVSVTKACDSVCEMKGYCYSCKVCDSCCKLHSSVNSVLSISREVMSSL